MGGKSGTTTSSVSIPPDVLKRYNAVNERAESVAATPFQPYTGQFVAGITPTQQAGINATTQYAQAAQPYYQAATGQLGQAQGQGQQAIGQAFGQLGQGVNAGQQYAQAATQGIGSALQAGQPYQGAATQAAFAGSQAITPENLNIQGYMSPYTQAVADTTYQALRQQQQQEMAGQTANAIRSGAFGGDRAGLVAANLARQQQLGTAQAMAPIYQQGFGQALSTATGMAQANRAALQNLASQLQGIGQQGFGQQMTAAQQMAGLGQQQFGQGLGAAQQLGALGQQQYGMGAGTAQQLAALGTGAQAAALQGAQAQLGAGTLEQQTQQADLTARYQQFLQERGYPFQVAQFLANIAMGTGALSGSTTTTTQPMPFFSDRRVKDDVKEIGKTHDGQPIYSFKYKGDDATRIGLMAQDVEKKHPEAVYDMGGVKGVDYKQATENAERPERYSGGIIPASQGGSVYEPGAYARGGYAPGGLVDPNDIQAILAQQKEAMGPFGEGGIYGSSHQDTPFAKAAGIVPKSRLHVPKLIQAGPAPRLPEGLGAQALGAYDQAVALKGRYDTAKAAAKKIFGEEETPQTEMDRTRVGQAATDRSKLTSADIMPDKKLEDEKGLIGKLGELTGLFADGGVVPREGFAVGGSKDPSLPYEEEDKTPYKYFPTEILETEKPELQKPNTPSQQSGSGLGTALTLAKFALGFFNQGGAVPRGRLANGGVYDPTLGRIVEAIEMTPERIAELNKEDVYSRELQPAAAPRFRVFERIAREEGAKGLKPTELYRSPERSAMLDLTMPEGAPRAKPYTSGHNYGLAVDYSNTTPENYGAIRKAAAATGLTSGLDFSNIDPPHVQLGKGSYGGLYGKDVVIDEGFGERSQKGVVPAEAQETAYEKARQVVENRGINPDSPTGRGMVSSVIDYFRQNQEFLVPFGAGLRGMVQSRSPFLGGALLEGLGTGLEAVGESQKQVADIALTRAQAMRQSLGLIAERYKILPGGKFFDTVENKIVSAEERNAEMQRLGLPVGMPPNVVEKAREVLESAGLPSETVAPVVTPKQETTTARTAEPPPVSTRPEPTPTPTETPSREMSKKYPDIPVVKSEVDIATNEIYAKAETDPQVNFWKQRRDYFLSEADKAQAAADDVRLRGQNEQAQTLQQQASALRENASQAQSQMLETREKIAQPSLAQLQGQVTIGQERDAKLLQQSTETMQQTNLVDYRLQEMRKNFSILPDQGWLTSGPYGEQRADIAKSINGVLQILGGNPAFDERTIAAGEALKKDTRRLGEDLAKSLGNNQAAAIIEGSIEATPSIQNTEMGWKLLLGSLEQANRYLQTRASYLNRYWEVNRTLDGALESFDQMYPVEKFVAASIAGIAKPQDAEALRNSVGTPNEKEYRRLIDAKYGSGVAKAILGE